MQTPFGRATRTSTITAVAVVLALTLATTPYALAGGSPSAADMGDEHSRMAPVLPPALCVPSSLGYGPVVIGPGNTTEWNGTGPGSVCLQQGSVTIDAGGTLIIQNQTVSMVQFVASSGTLAERLSNISRFVDAGNVVLRNAVLTTDASVPNAYLKLNLTVTGTLTLWNSSLEFPGWFNIEHSANVTLYNSTVTGNPHANDTGLARSIVGDTSFAASVLVDSAARLVLEHSFLAETYSDNLTANGSAGPEALTDNVSVTITPTSSALLNGFGTPTGTQSLIQDWLYPIEYPAVDLSLEYSMASGSVTSDVSVAFNGTHQNVAAVTFLPGTNQIIKIQLPPTLLQAINSAGPYGFLTATGSFDHNAPFVSVTFNASGIGTSSANISRIMLTAVPSLSFDVVCTGTGSQVLAADSGLDLNWNHLPTSPSSTAPPFPWDSNKMVALDHSTLLLANLSVQTRLPGSSAVSAVQADTTSKVFTYRWAEFGAVGPGGAIPGARVTAFSSAQGADNATATSLNDLSRTSSALWGYVRSWDAERGLPGYGLTGSAGPVAGRAFLLLAASNLTDSASTNASFIGGYHVVVSPPLTEVPPAWLGFNVTAYPYGLENASPDVAPTSYFPEYAAALTITSVTFTADDVPTAGSASIGQVLGVHALVTNVGATPVLNLSGVLQYVPTAPAAPSDVAAVPLTSVSIGSGESTLVNFTWRVNETTVGVHGTIHATVNVTVDWNGGPTETDGGATNASGHVEILPSQITITQLQAPAHNLSATAIYISQGIVVFNGSGLASITLTASPVNGGAAVILSTNASTNGTFDLVYSNLGQVLESGVAYLFQAAASYNGANSTLYRLPGNYTIPAGASAGQGLTIPWWVWPVVAGAIVAGVGVYLARRRRPAPQVECGECASLVPAGSQTCPTCGIYFETESERCARCLGDIPAGVLDCPNCHYRPSDRPGPPGPEEDRQAFEEHLAQFRAAAQGELGDDYPQVEFWKWWRRQPSFQSFRDWKTGQETPKRSTDVGEDSGLDGMDGGS